MENIVQLILNIKEKIRHIVFLMEQNKSNITKYKLLGEEYLIYCNQLQHCSELFSDEIKKMKIKANNVLSNIHIEYGLQ